MARKDQMKALYEFFGGTPNTFHTTNGTVFPDIKTIVKGEPIEKMQLQMPLLYITAPKSKETRREAQVKFITYQLMATLVYVGPGTQVQNADRGASTMDMFYGLIDDIANQIRTNKMLITPSYPDGASIKFGENFTIDEGHDAQGQMMTLVAQFQIESVEQVFA